MPGRVKHWTFLKSQHVRWITNKFTAVASFKCRSKMASLDIAVSLQVQVRELATFLWDKTTIVLVVGGWAWVDESSWHIYRVMSWWCTGGDVRVQQRWWASLHGVTQTVHLAPQPISLHGQGGCWVAVFHSVISCFPPLYAEGKCSLHLRLKALSGIFFQEFVLLISQLSILLVSVTVHLSKEHHLFTRYFCCFRTVAWYFYLIFLVLAQKKEQVD